MIRNKQFFCVLGLSFFVEILSASSHVQTMQRPSLVPDILDNWRSYLRQTRSDLCLCKKNEDKLQLGCLKQQIQERINQLYAIQDEMLTNGWKQERLQAIMSFDMLNSRLLEIYKEMPAHRQSTIQQALKKTSDS